MATDEELDRAWSRYAKTKEHKKRVQEITRRLESFNQKAERYLSDEDLREALSASQRVAELEASRRRRGLPLDRAKEKRPIRPESEAAGGFEHSDDYRSVRLRGLELKFTPRQAALIQFVDRQRLEGWSEVSTARALEEAEAQSSKLKDLFRSTSGWRALIIKGTKRGMIRLNV